MNLRTNNRVLTNLFVLLCCVPLAILQDQETERLIAELQLDDLELIDACEYSAYGRKQAILDQLFDKTVEQQRRFGEIVKGHYEQLRTFTDIPSDLERNWTYQVKPGDALLAQDKWDKLIVFQNHIQELTTEAKLCFENETDLCLTGIGGYNNALNNERKYDTLKKTWKSWQTIYTTTDISDFNSQLGFIKDAATVNEFDSVQDYWEALLDFPGAYEQADAFWDSISPFYAKLQKFVRERLFKYYKLQHETNEIPAYLIGGQLGTDWSSIADIILPHPQLHYDAESYLKYKSIEDMYKYAENVTSKLGLGALGANFWENSIFNSSICGSQLLEFCDQAYSQLITCKQTSWSVYLDVQETALRVALNNLDYSSIPRQNLRYNAIDDAVQKLGSLLAIESLDYHGIVDAPTNQTDDDPAQMTKRLLTALRLMPGLPYSLMADKWRMEAIEQNNTNLAGSWWKYRKDYSGVVGIENNEPEYLEDSRIVSNRPHLNQFFGTLVAFQIFMYYKERAGSQYVVNEFEQEEFVTLLRRRHTTEWPFLLTNQYGLDVRADELLSYFAPLEQYFESAPTEQVAIVTPTTTTTTQAPTTKAQLVTKDNYVLNDQPKPKVRASEAKKVVEEADSHVAMYVGVAGLVVVACALALGVVFKKFRRRSSTNNRRFDS
uniref:Angiotensin-converting enzyme n=1 Tax=Dendroctonus ponderosae TaxID=77166 RepID=A0AAR5PBB4_DENPD